MHTVICCKWMRIVSNHLFSERQKRMQFPDNTTCLRPPFGTATAIRDNTWLSLQYLLSSSRICLIFFFFCRSQTGRLNEDMIETILFASFRSLRVALIFAISPGWNIDLDLLSGLFVSQGVGVSFRGFHWAFSVMIAVTPQARELIWKFYQILNMSFYLHIWGSEK